MTTFDYTEEDIASPAGSNSLSARAKFFQRSLYKEVIYPEEVTTPLDAWHDKNLFGRLDRQQYSIIPYGRNMVQVSKAVSSNIRCLNFVNDAFTDFVLHMENAYMTNCINRAGNPKLFRIKAVRGYDSPTSKYFSFTDTLARAFADNYKENTRAPIKNFTDFKKPFKAYLKTMAEKLPITFSNYVLSTRANSFISGLKISIAHGDASEDRVKYDDFVNDPNFLFYIQSAKKYGFTVDKNAPWILTADLFSDAILKYIGFYTEAGTPITPQNFFEIYYYRTYTSDVEYLRYLFYTGYQALYDVSPLYEEEKKNSRRHCSGEPFKIIVGHRAPPTGVSTLTPQELIDMYAFLRRREAANSGPSLSFVRKRSYEIYRDTPPGSLSLEVSKYINDAYKDFIYPASYATVNTNLDLDSVSVSGILDTAVDVSVSTGDY